jgi:hypothetical protein
MAQTDKNSVPLRVYLYGVIVVAIRADVLLSFTTQISLDAFFKFGVKHILPAFSFIPELAFALRADVWDCFPPRNPGMSASLALVTLRLY